MKGAPAIAASGQSYRVFISYARKDQALAAQAREIMLSLGLLPTNDTDLKPGFDFDPQIRSQIGRSHLLLALLTPAANRSSWVHAEIGFALGARVPVMPVTVAGLVPSTMLSGTQALCVGADLSGLAEGLAPANLQWLMANHQRELGAVFECHYYSQERSQRLADAAELLIRDLRVHVPIRLNEGLTSFSLPNAPVHDRIWDACEGTHQRSEVDRTHRRRERVLFEEHARHSGCELMIETLGPRARRDPAAQLTRLGVLRGFLETMPDDKVRVVVRGRPELENAVFLGDYFMAHAQATKPGAGWRQTMATWHAPTVLYHLDEFRTDFQLAYDEQAQERAGLSSREFAIRQIAEAVASLGG